MRHFELALTADPTSDEARYDLADAYFHVRDYSRAFEVLQQVSAIARDDSYLFLLGDVEAHLGQLDEALQIFRHAVERNPDNDQYYLMLAMAYLRKGNTDEAERVLHQGLARVPNSARIHWGMGIISVLQGNNREAEDNLVTATDLMPEWVSGFSALGFFYSKTGQMSKARETLERFKTVNRSGELDVSKIEQMLDQESAQNNAPGSSLPLSPEARLQFLQVALTLADRDL
jgi:Flp pilus assembly protein TadD